MPKLAQTYNKTRIQIDLSDREVERMKDVMDQCGIESRKDLFKEALALLEWAAHEVKQGFKVSSFDEKSKERNSPLMNSLQNATRREK